MPLSVDRHSPSTQRPWEPEPLHVPAEDGYAGDRERGPEQERDNDERPSGSHVYVIDLG